MPTINQQTPTPTRMFASRLDRPKAHSLRHMITHRIVAGQTRMGGGVPFAGFDGSPLLGNVCTHVDQHLCSKPNRFPFWGPDLFVFAGGFVVFSSKGKGGSAAGWGEPGRRYVTRNRGREKRFSTDCHSRSEDQKTARRFLSVQRGTLRTVRLYRRAMRVARIMGVTSQEVADASHG